MVQGLLETSRYFQKKVSRHYALHWKSQSVLDNWCDITLKLVILTNWQLMLAMQMNTRVSWSDSNSWSPPKQPWLLIFVWLGLEVLRDEDFVPMEKVDEDTYAFGKHTVSAKHWPIQLLRPAKNCSIFENDQHIVIKNEHDTHSATWPTVGICIDEAFWLELLDIFSPVDHYER